MPGGGNPANPGGNPTRPAVAPPSQALRATETPEKHEGWYLDGLTEDEYQEQQQRKGEPA